MSSAVTISNELSPLFVIYEKVFEIQDNIIINDQP